MNNFPKLQEQIRYCYEHSPYYRALFDDLGLVPEDFKTPEDITRIPTTTKADIERNYEQFLCVPRDRIAEFVTTSGTVGEPIVIALTREDLDRLAINEKNSFSIAGITDKDVIQITTTLDRMFMAGLAYYSGAQLLGATTIRVGIGAPQLQIDSIRRLQPTVLVGVPSFILKLIHYAKSQGFDLNQSSVRKIICIGEPIRTEDLELNTIGEKIVKQWNVDLHSTYASTEMATAFTECEHQCGCHHQPDLIFIEMVDEEGNHTEGEGEVIATPLGVTGMPLLRYKTEDISRLITTPCACGNDGVRLLPIKGRKKQMIKYKGTSIFPGVIVEQLRKWKEVDQFQVCVSKDENDLDLVKVILESSLQNDNTDQLKELFRSTIRFVPELDFVSREELKNRLEEPGSRKPKWFVDERLSNR